MSKTKLMLGDNIQSLKKLPDNSIDSIVSDPPYGLSFMNKKWDYDVPSVEFWKEVYRVLKPGGHILSFGGTRTYHRMVVNIEDAGFEIRDQIMWLYGSGFPKSHNIGKAVDKLEGNDREVVGNKGSYRDIRSGSLDAQLTEDRDRIDVLETKGNSDWEGWGTALKPANEPICVARKPLSEKSVAENVLKWGTGGINVDGCRVGTETIKSVYGGFTNALVDGRDEDTRKEWIENSKKENGQFNTNENEGRFPANIILDEIAGELLDEQSGISKARSKYPEVSLDNLPMNHYETTKIKHTAGREQTKEGFSDKGGASRFFYQAKVSKAERNMGLDGFDGKKLHSINQLDDRLRPDGTLRETPIHKNNHPTVKPVSLMSYLCRLVTPPNGIVLDPFMGSGSTGIAAQLEGFRFCGMEMDGDYFKIAETRIENYEQYKKFIKK
jgi:site-specific DNA-methyltransferase (adenine-specific)